MIISRTPFRISFFGGGTDYPAWYREHGGAVLSTTIDKYCYIMVRELPPFFPFKYRIAYSKVEQTNSIEEIEHPAIRAVLREMKIDIGLEIHIASDLPARSGLGSSSSFVVGLLNALNALNGNKPSPKQLTADAIRIEQDILMESVGSQDQTAAAYGGLNLISFSHNIEPNVFPLKISSSRKAELNNHLLLFFTGFTRSAHQVATEQIRNIPNRESELRHIQSLVAESATILNSTRNINEFGKLLDETWFYKKKLSSLITNDAIDQIYSNARDAGAIGGKLLGAGNGGFMLIFAEPSLHSNIILNLNQYLHVKFQLTDIGTQIIS